MRAGVYPDGIAEDVSAERLKSFFTHDDAGYRVNRMLRDTVVFAAQNVLKDPPFTKLDLIVCRNLLIYLTTEVQKRLLPVLHYALRSGGLLFLGSSESIGGLGDLFDTVDGKWKIYRRRNVDSILLPVVEGQRHAKPPHELAAPPAEGARARPSTAADVQRLLAAHFAPPSVVVDSRANIIYLHGRLGQYLEPREGQPSSNILDMAREGLGAALASALHQAQSDKKEIVRKNVRVRTNGSFSLVDVVVTPIQDPESMRGLVLISFQAATEIAPTAPSSEPPTTHEQELERELQYARESLQSSVEEAETTNEELRSSNEELQSTNEELQSSNEELETSKEEMQSLNEELNTVNAELQSKVDDLALVRDDMQNLLNSTQVASVFLDQHLCVKRFTEQARNLIRLIESDVGRPLMDLALNFQYERLQEHCREVLRTLAPQEAEVQDLQGHWHLLRILPYRSAENVISGVVVTLVNIDRVKRAERSEVIAAAARDFFQSIVQTVREPLLVLGQDLKAVMANNAFYRAVGLSAEAVEGRLVYELGDRQWDIPQLRELLEGILSKNAAFTDFRLEHDFPKVGRRVLLLNARRLEQSPGLTGMILVTMTDITQAANE